jgi:hypothetical protein
MKQKPKRRANGPVSRQGRRRRGQTIYDRIHDRVRGLMEGGAVEDEIALELGVDKNQLRRKHIRALRQGRETRRQQQAETELASLTREELHCLDAIVTSFNDPTWLTSDGCSYLWRGVDGKAARSPADAFAGWQERGSRFICTGLNGRFSPERFREFAELKAEAEKLLQKSMTEQDRADEPIE